MAAASTTIFDRTSALARELGAINLGQGFPDLPEPAELLEAARRALVERSNQYPPMRGLAELRRAVAAYYAQEQGLAVAEEEVIVTSGATEALAAAILAFVRPGDEAILFEPFYDAYLPLVERAGGTVRTVGLVPPRWTLPLDAFEAAIGPKTRLVILNTPNNPTGTVVDRATLEALAALCVRHDLILLCDEVWEGMIYGERRHVSPLAVPTLRERTIKVGSAGKIFSLTGWKIGWLAASPEMATLAARAHQFLTFASAPNLQAAVAYGMAEGDAWLQPMRERFSKARDRMISGLETAGYAALPSASTYFLCVDLAASGISLDDEAFAKLAVEQAGVAVIPLSSFSGEGEMKHMIRLCFAKRDETIDAGVAALAKAKDLAA